MTDPRSNLRRLVDEGARAARQPPLAELRRRARRRRTVRRTAVAVPVVAAILAAFPLLDHERSKNARPAATVVPPSPSPSVVVSPSQTTTGTVVTVSGAGCAPGQAVSVGLRWDRGAPLTLSPAAQKAQPKPHPTATSGGSIQLSSVTAAADGSFTVAVPIPGGFTIRTPKLWARCERLNQEIVIVVRAP